MKLPGIVSYSVSSCRHRSDGQLSRQADYRNERPASFQILGFQARTYEKVETI